MLLRSLSPSCPATTRFRDAKVRRIYLVHGTFAGDDALGLIGGLQRLIPAAGDWMAQLSKQAVDHVVGDMGNYTSLFAQRLEEGIAETAGDLDRPIEVRRFLWSSENLHIARAHAVQPLVGRLVLFLRTAS